MTSGKQLWYRIIWTRKLCSAICTSWTMQLIRHVLLTLIPHLDTIICESFCHSIVTNCFSWNQTQAMQACVWVDCLILITHTIGRYFHPVWLLLAAYRNQVHMHSPVTPLQGDLVGLGSRVRQHRYRLAFFVPAAAAISSVVIVPVCSRVVERRVGCRASTATGDYSLSHWTWVSGTMASLPDKLQVCGF